MSSAGQTRKRGSKKSPKKLEAFDWLKDPVQQLKRSVSFEGTEITDEDFYKFFENIGEGYNSQGRPVNRKNKSKTKKSLKPKSPRPNKNSKPKSK